MRLNVLTIAMTLCVMMGVSPVMSSLALAQTETAPPVMVPNSFANLAERVQDAVVNVSTTQKIKPVSPEGIMPPGIPHQGVPIPEFPPGSPFQDFFQEFYNNPNGFGGPDMGMLPPAQSLGSGFIIDAKKGLIVTNNHVIDQAEEIQVILHDDTKLKAEVLGRDPETDLAILKIETVKPLVQVTWGDSDVMRVGDWILAVGNPFGLGGTVTSGIISARKRNINAGRYDDFIQTDASINRGNSGGPMFNTRGEVIGINTAIFSPTGGSVGIGFAIPSNLARPVIEQLLKYGTTRRGWIGVRIQDVTPEIAESLGLDRARGALVASTTPDGPADKAGIKQGDILLKFDDKDIVEMRYLPRIVADAEIGKKTTMRVFRHGKEISVDITPEQLEKAKEKGLLDDDVMMEKSGGQPLNATRIEELSMRVAPLTDTLRQQYGLSADMQGVIVTDVTRSSDAAKKGIMPGDVILEVNQSSVKTPKDVKQAVEEAKKEKKNSVLLLVNSQNNLRFVAVKLGE